MPASVKVGPHVYSVVRQTKAQMPNLMGDSDFDLMQIRVRQRLKKSKSKEILIHELLHVCSYPSFTGVYAENEKYAPEEMINAIAPVLLQVVQDNPELLEYLTQ